LTDIQDIIIKLLDVFIGLKDKYLDIYFFF
jgi:hypothetical protein